MNPPRVTQLAEATRILLVRLDNIGDVVLLSAAIREIDRACPRARLTLLTTPAGASVAPLLPWIDDVIVHRPIWQDLHGDPGLGTESERRLVGDLSARAFDAAFIFTSFSQSPEPAAYACLLAGIPVRVGHRTPSFSGRVLDPGVEPPPVGLHQAERSLHLVESVGVPAANRRTDVSIPPAEADAAEQLLAEAGIEGARPFAALAPGASCAARRAKPALLAAVAEHLSQAATPVVLVGGARDAEATGPIASATGAIDLTGRTSVPQLAAVIDRAAVAITMNSAPLHLADALGTPLVVLYSGTDLESQWEPRQARSRVFRRPTDCSPCYLLESAFDVACLDLDPVEIARAALAFIEPPILRPAHTETAWIASAS